MKMWFIAPHMHQWGKNITIDVKKSGAQGADTQLFNTDWDPTYAFHPPEIRKDPTAPLVLDPGDKVAVHCEWNNTSGHELNFGFEMCVAFGQFVDDQNAGNWECDNGQWGNF